MGTQQRRDLQANIPALRKLDTMLLDYLDNYKDRNEFWYVKRDSCSDSDKEGSERSDEKWWIPIVKVPPDGLSPASRGWLQHQKELVNQVLKAAMAINANCLMEMASRGRSSGGASAAGAESDQAVVVWLAMTEEKERSSESGRSRAPNGQINPRWRRRPAIASSWRSPAHTRSSGRRSPTRLDVHCLPARSFTRPSAAAPATPPLAFETTAAVRRAPSRRHRRLRDFGAGEKENTEREEREGCSERDR